MVTIETFRKLALSFSDSVEIPHHEKTSFRVKKKIFATLDEGKKRATLKFSEIDQSVFCDFGNSVYPVPNKWGKQGWTFIELDGIPKELIKDALKTAYTEVLKSK